MSRFLRTRLDVAGQSEATLVTAERPRGEADQINRERTADNYAYQYQNLNSNGTPIGAADLPAGGAKGPGGDTYLYAHLQVDAQANVRVAQGLSVIVYGLNLTNEVFGFFNGSPEYVSPREFYKPTFAFGVRWNPPHC
jgi:hypothetical protein